MPVVAIYLCHICMRDYLATRASTWQSQHHLSHLDYTISSNQDGRKGARLTKSLLDVTIYGKLTSSQPTNHEQTSRETGEGAAEAKFTSNLHETRYRALTREALGLVDFRQHGISGLGNDGSGEASEETGSQVDGRLAAAGQLGLVKLGKDGLGNLLKCDKLGHGVGNPVHKCQLPSHPSSFPSRPTYCLKRIGPNPE